MVRSAWIVCIVLLLTTSFAKAQVVVDSLEQTDEPFFEAIEQSPDAEALYQDWLEDLNSYAEFPLIIATSTARMLARIPTLDQFQRRALTLENTTSRNQEFVTASKSLPAILTVRSRLITDPNIRDEAGFQNGAFAGSAQRYYNVLKAGWDKLALVVLASKDAGEASFADRLNGYLTLREPIAFGDLSIEQFVAGDYRLGFGNGLTFGSAVNSLKTRQSVTSLDPHASGIEGSTRSNAMRGAATTISIGDPEETKQHSRADISLFYSNAPLDALFDSSGITSIVTSGYHRTASELSHQNTAKLMTFGAHVSAVPALFEHILTEIGATAYRAKLDHPVSANARLAAGVRQEDIYAADIQLVSSHVAANGEIARSVNELGIATAEAAALTIKPEEKLSVVLQFRNIPEHYLSRYAAVFGERSADGKAENGVYLGIDWKFFNDRFTLTAFSDLSHPGGISSTLISPTSDHLAGIEYALPHNALSLYAQFHVKSKDELSPDTLLPAGAKAHGTREQQNLLFEGTVKIAGPLSFKFQAQRVAIVHSSKDSSGPTGYLFYIGPHLEFHSSLTLDGRFVFYHSSSYDARLYEYEPDVPGSSSFSPLYGDGWRAYLLASATPSTKIKFSAKWSVTHFPVTRIINTGVTARVGNQEVRISLQADVRF
jgi:hypothetical protein